MAYFLPWCFASMHDTLDKLGKNAADGRFSTACQAKLCTESLLKIRFLTGWEMPGCEAFNIPRTKVR